MRLLSFASLSLVCYSSAFPLSQPQPRADTGTVSRRSFDVVPSGLPVFNEDDSSYAANITLGGRNFQVAIDTGSSDLFLFDDVDGTQDLGTSLGKNASITFSIGAVAGEIRAADFAWEGFQVQDQAFLLVSAAGRESGDFDGLIGLGPPANSVIDRTIGNDTGAYALQRIFDQNLTSQNFITMLLGRSNDTGPTAFDSQFTISEVIEQFQAVTTMPQQPMEIVPASQAQRQHLQSLIEGITGPNGTTIHLQSVVTSVPIPSGSAVAVYDSGFTLPQVPQEVADLFYKDVPGSQFFEDGGVYILPCDALLEVSFQIAGVNYPIHPLDTNSLDLVATFDPPPPANFCIGAFQPAITTATSANFDMVLGMSFLRNVYALYDYGTFINETSNDRGEPFIQFLSITDPDAARADFVAQRGSATA